MNYCNDYEVIGPSKCDEKRKSREKDIANIWNIIINTPCFHSLYSLFSEALNMFREALSCYQNGAYMATALMCGVCLEAALIKLTAMRNPKIYGNEVIEYEINSSISYSEYDEALHKAKSQGILNGKLENKINKIRAWRNFVAHYVQRKERKLQKSISLIIKKKTVGKSSEEIIILWLSRNNAYTLLKETAESLSEIIQRTCKALGIRDSTA